MRDTGCGFEWFVVGLRGRVGRRGERENWFGSDQSYLLESLT